MFLSALTVSTVGLTSKAFFKLGLASVSVSGLQNLSKALESDDRANGCGIVTGQVLETFRGKGIYQPAVESAIEKLNKGDWIHLFGEGKVNQPGTYTTDIKGRATLPRFKWGIGRILTSTASPPVVIPMWITGFDKVMPEGRPFPFKYLPRIGARLTVSFGEPLPADAVSSIVDRISAAQREEQDPTRKIQLDVLVRTEVTTMVHDAVEALGRSRCGDSLTA
ncbi:Lyso-phosphatidylcholine acyltransferase [Marasmius sp. AFHP31]|nr:Lyso-phosphatidylcholine acyltransferase [Marasmius sp. AFHP31]